MKIVFVDAKTLGSGIDLSGFQKLGEVQTYPLSTPEEARERIKDADIVITNKVPMNAFTLEKADHVKMIAVAATGTNNLDKEYLEKRGIRWTNAAGYSTDAVAQHTFAMLFYLLEHLPHFDAYVKNGDYEKSGCFTSFEPQFRELSSMTWGIIGLGAIGKRVAGIASAFGCHVIWYSTSGAHEDPEYERVDFDTLLEQSDIVSVHAPLNEKTENLMNRDAFRRMKNSAIFINVGRGPIVNEADLADALETGDIAAAGLDVLSTEPISPENPLRKIKDSGKLLITPHMAWATVEARKRLMQIVEKNVRDFVTGSAEIR